MVIFINKNKTQKYKNKFCFQNTTKTVYILCSIKAQIELYYIWKHTILKKKSTTNQHAFKTHYWLCTIILKKCICKIELRSILQFLS